MSELRDVPKVVLHDHLDGGLRPATVIELADQVGYTDLPTSDVGALAEWFDQATSRSLERYLESFVHTIGVMQTAEGVERVAYEAVEDAAMHGVIYAEFRTAPSIHTTKGLAREDVIEAILAGLARGERETGITARYIADALRQDNDSVDVARACMPFIGRGLVGFDLAGPEAGFPADLHLAACRMIRQANLGLTIHAGEGDGPNSIWRALQMCGAHRIGHGVRIIDDCVLNDGAIVTLGPLASYMRDFRVPLEVCPTSNLQTIGWTASEHPIGALYDAGFAVTVSPDNRLMSRVDMTSEYQLLAEHQGFGPGHFADLATNAIDAAFCDAETKAALRGAVEAWRTEV